MSTHHHKIKLERRVEALTDAALAASVKMEDAQLEYSRALLELAHAVQLLQQHNYEEKERHKARSTDKRIRTQISAMRRAS